jgi:hypothetical protein
LKKDGEVKKGKATSFGLKPDVTIILTDETFMDIAEGRTTGQKAFMTGAVKTRGNMLLALKLDGILKVCQYCLFGHAHMTNCACYQEHEGKGEAVNCGAFVVSAAARHTYHRLIAILEFIVVMCRERPGQWYGQRTVQTCVGRCANPGRNVIGWLSVKPSPSSFISAPLEINKYLLSSPSFPHYIQPPET